MPGLALLMLQVASSALPGPDPAGQAMLHPARREACKTDSTDIVVCAKDQERYRLPNTGPAVDEPLLPKAEWRVFGDAKMAVDLQQRGVPGGGGSKPAPMVHLTVPF